MTSLPEVNLGPLSSLADRRQEITETLCSARPTPSRTSSRSYRLPAVQSLGAIAGVMPPVNQAGQQPISDILHMREAAYFEHVGSLKDACPDLESRIGALVAVVNAALLMFLGKRNYWNHGSGPGPAAERGTESAGGVRRLHRGGRQRDRTAPADPPTWGHLRSEQPTGVRRATPTGCSTCSSACTAPMKRQGPV